MRAPVISSVIRDGYELPVSWRQKLMFRIIVCIVAFSLSYLAVIVRLVDVTVIHPHMPSRAILTALQPDINFNAPPPDRASIVDRNGTLLAVSLPSAALFANPQQISHADLVATKLKSVLPDINQKLTAKLLSLKKASFVYIDRKLTPDQEMAVNRMGIPGLYFQKTWLRHYPNGTLAAHILGGVTPGQNGISGVEEYFNKRLSAEPSRPLRLSIDLRVQAIVHRELARSMKDYDARGACAIVESMSGRILAMVSLPTYNANGLHDASPDALTDRCISGDYEPGSVMKLMTLAAALQSGLLHVWDRFNTSHPLLVDGFAITDYEPVHHWLAMPAILAYSSNIGASRIATILGPKIQRAWLQKMGFFDRSPIQMPGAQRGLWHNRQNWNLLTTMSVSFGNGIAMTPIVLVNAIVADLNGGILFKPTLLARRNNALPRRGVQVMRPSVSVRMREMMRDVVLSGTGAYARIPGYLVGGKTGTSQIVGANGRYDTRLNDASFVGVFPVNHPRYVIYALVIHPKATKKMQKFSYGFTTGGYVAAPAVGRIINRIGPMLGIRPLSGEALARANAKWQLPLIPTPPSTALALGPQNPLPQGASKFAYILSHRTVPSHSGKAVAIAALNRAKMAIPGQVRPLILAPAEVASSPAVT
jgi:cell division protein FtsI (penicillin-binding protein 3)